jgi:hypothetical protein
MKSKLLLITCLFVGMKPSVGQKNIGPKLIAMGRTGAAIPDVWSVVANPSMLNECKKITAALSYQKPLVDVNLNSQAFGLIYPLERTAFGIYCYRYGIEDFNEIVVSSIVSKKFGHIFSFAIRGNYNQIKITDYGTTKSLLDRCRPIFFP